jgi:predicted ArsR family transcriptional regulator
MAEGHIEGSGSEGLQGRVTIKQAATLLGVHPNTVRKRVKEGVYEAEKVSTEYGVTWMLDRNTLLNTPPTRDAQIYPLQSAGNLESTPEALVQGLLRPFVEDLGRVREELGAERVRREQAEEKAARLEAELEALREPRDTPERVASDTSSTDTPTSDTEEPRRPGWLRRFFGFE